MSDLSEKDPSVVTKPCKRERCTADVRRRAILDAAAAVFLERGYAGASVDAVVERAGGSKASVYAMFGSKLGLLEALVAESADIIAESVSSLPLDQPIAISLRSFGEFFLKLILNPSRLALFRLVVGESGRMPELGDIFYRNGPEETNRRLAEYFRAEAQLGRIRADDPERLANYFVGTVRGDFHFRALFNPTRTPTAKEIAQHLDFVVKTFLREVAV
jgi:AcrR family transcriptional regulator